MEHGAFPIVSQEDGLVNGFWNGKADVFRISKPVVLFGDHTQALKYVDFDFVLGADGVKILQPKDPLNAKFLYYQLQATTLPTLGYARHYRLLKDVPIACPAPAEQRRIVGILDKAFAAIATAKANTERNLQNARAAFQSKLEGVFAAAFAAGSSVALSKITTDVTDGDHLPPPKSASGVPFITIGNIVKGTRKIDFEDTFMVPRAYFESLKPNRKPKKGDVLYTVTGSFGIPVFVENGTEFCFQRHIGLVRPKPETDSRWLYYLLLSPQIFSQADERATGAAQRTVSLHSLRNFLVPNIPIAVQREIASSLDSLSVQVEELEEKYRRKVTVLDELRKSVLHAAFNGRL